LPDRGVEVGGNRRQCRAVEGPGGDHDVPGADRAAVGDCDETALAGGDPVDSGVPADGKVVAAGVPGEVAGGLVLLG